MKNKSQTELTPDSALTPVAVLISGEAIVSLVVQIAVEDTTYYTLLTGKDWPPTGWGRDDMLITAVVTKHHFQLLPLDSNVPTIRWGSRNKDMKVLEQWIAQHRKQLE